MIHPHVLVGIPCYDLTPIICPTLDGSFLAVRPPASGITNSHGLTGGVYKARERIHRDTLLRDYSRFQLHEVELQTSIRTENAFMRFAYSRELASLCRTHCSTFVAQVIKGMMI